MHSKVWNVFDGFLFKMYFATIFISDFVVYKTIRDFHALNLICHVIYCITDIKVHLLYFNIYAWPMYVLYVFLHIGITQD